MRVAFFWEFYEPFHFLIILIFFVLIFLLVFGLVRARKRLAKGFYVAAIIVSLSTGFVLLTAYLPGHGLDDSSYRLMKFQMTSLQQKLSGFYRECGVYPTTSQGLGVLDNIEYDSRCTDKEAEGSKYLDIKYSSDGKSYEMESIRKYARISGLLVRATSDAPAGFYIRE